MIGRTAGAALLAAAALTTAAPAGAATPIAAPGMPIWLNHSSRCTLGYTASNAAGDHLAVTAGHCGSPGDVVTDQNATPIGVVAAAQPDDITAHTYGYDIIALRRGVTPSTSITRTLSINHAAQAARGDSVCLFGVTSGVHCGIVAAITPGAGVIAGFASEHGDSGGPIIRTADHALVGILISHNNALNTSYYEPIARIHALTTNTGDGGPRFGAVVDNPEP
jgi:hypothetical protein